MIRLNTPLTEEKIAGLKVGDQVLISGTLYSARDAAHKRMVEGLDGEKPLPFDIRGQIVFYMGPCPAVPGEIIGPAGPTTSHRMDAYTPALLHRGLKGMIGKGNRTAPVVDAIVENQAVYFVCAGGTGMLSASCITDAQVIAYDDLGAEAIRRLIVKDFPVIVAIDAKGNNIYENEIKKYRNYLKDKQEEVYESNGN